MLLIHDLLVLSHAHIISCICLCRSLQYLYDNAWFDVHTQAIFVEFTVYNANVNLFCIVTLMLESAATGVCPCSAAVWELRSDSCVDVCEMLCFFQERFSSAASFRLCVSTSQLEASTFLSWPLKPSTSSLSYITCLFRCIFIILILPSLLEILWRTVIHLNLNVTQALLMSWQGKLMKQQKWTYFKSKWNLLELAIIILSWSALSVFIKRTLLGLRDMDYYQNNKDQ